MNDREIKCERDTSANQTKTKNEKIKNKIMKELM